MISLNYRDPRPIYEQIVDGFRRLMVTGGLSPGEKLPSVRELAAQLAINPNTIQRAYRELEAEGYICSVPGKGSFAADTGDVDAARRYRLLDELDRVISELRYLGVSPAELVGRITETWENGGKQDDRS